MENKHKKILYSPHKQYRDNIMKLIEISKLIDNDNKYSISEINTKFFKEVFKDLRAGSKWYEEEQWRPIKTSIHNCYKLVQNGYIADNQRELETNLIILEKLIREPNPKKMRLEKLSEQVVQNIFDNALGVIREKAQKQEVIRKSIGNMPEELRNEMERFEKMKEIPKGIVDKVIKDEKIDCNYKECKHKEKVKKIKILYEEKINKLEKRVNELEKEMEKMKIMLKTLGQTLYDI